jgi:hypothetical protein
MAFLTKIFELGIREPFRREGLEPVGREEGGQEDEEGDARQDDGRLEGPRGVVPVSDHDVEVDDWRVGSTQAPTKATEGSPGIAVIAYLLASEAPTYTGNTESLKRGYFQLPRVFIFQSTLVYLYFYTSYTYLDYFQAL